MDENSCDIEFFDFGNASEEEIKEIRTILLGPGNNGCVELPWEIPLRESCAESSIPENEGVLDKNDLQSAKSTKELGAVVGPALHFAAAQAPLSPPVARLPPPPQAVETFIAPPTTVGPYPNASYFVSRTIPYLRAYPHMGVPFFACPIPGAAGENGPLPSHYGQFVPVVPATVAQEKFMGHIENESIQKIRPSDRQFNRRSKKKSSSDFSSNSFESETVLDAYRESIPSAEQTSVSFPVSSTVSSERPTSVPIVPLPVPPSSFGVAGGTLPLHGYPPGLHTLPYTQMSAPQAPSPAMYYVPVFNHPYGSYIPSPPSAPMVLPVNLQPETETPSPVNISNEVVLTNLEAVVPPVSLSEPCESAPNVQSNCEPTTPDQYVGLDNVKSPSLDSVAKNISEEDVTDCNSSSDYPMSKSVSSSPDCIPDAGIADDCYSKCLPASEDVKQAGRDSSRCWADLFKKPHPEVNGIDRRLSTQQRHDSSTLKKDVVNGKVYVPASDIH